MAEAEAKKNQDSRDTGQNKKGRPVKILPTDRINFQKQVDLVRAYGSAYSAKNEPVGNGDVAPMVGLNASTVSLANAFLVDAGFLQRVEGGFVAVPEVLAFSHAHQWDPEKAPTKLGPILSRSWFGQALLPRLSFKVLSEDEAIQVLAEVARADKSYLPQLRTILEFLDAAAVIVREAGQVRLMPSAREEVLPAPKSPPAPPPPVSGGKAGGVAQSGIHFDVNVSVSMAEISSWTPERIAAFFDGIAKVLAAKNLAHSAENP